MVKPFYRAIRIGLLYHPSRLRHILETHTWLHTQSIKTRHIGNGLVEIRCEHTDCLCTLGQVETISEVNWLPRESAHG